MSDRWEGNVHCRDFSAESPTYRQDRDAVVLAEAWVYSSDERYALGIVVLVSGIDLATRKVTLEVALEKGRGLRDKLAGELQSEARDLKSYRVYLYAWTGQLARGISRMEETEPEWRPGTFLEPSDPGRRSLSRGVTCPG